MVSTLVSWTMPWHQYELELVAFDYNWLITTDHVGQITNWSRPTRGEAAKKLTLDNKKLIEIIWTYLWKYEGYLGLSEIEPERNSSGDFSIV